MATSCVLLRVTMIDMARDDRLHNAIVDRPCERESPSDYRLGHTHATGMKSGAEAHNQLTIEAVSFDPETPFKESEFEIY